MLKRAPEGMRFNPSGLRRLCCYFLLIRPTWNLPYQLFQCWISSRCGRGPRAYMQPKAALKPDHLAVGRPGLAIVIFLPIIAVSLRMRPCGGRASPGFTGLANASELASLHHLGYAAFGSDAIGVGKPESFTGCNRWLTGREFQVLLGRFTSPQTTS
ncbi:MAG: hypothetical protein CME97_00075 [Hyphomonas sp.]|nr:hypothetical protein [Hyphomonas sp.]